MYFEQIFVSQNFKNVDKLKPRCARNFEGLISKKGHLNYIVSSVMKNEKKCQKMNFV